MRWKVSDKDWHVDIVSRVELVFDPVVLVEPKHEFSGSA